MPLLYFFETSVEHGGMPRKDLYKLWAEHAKSSCKWNDEQFIKYSFKVAGERTVVGVISVESPGVLDTCFDDFPLPQALGDQIHTRFTPLRQYEGFASDVSERAGIDAKYEEEKAVSKEGLLYLLTFTVEYDPAMTQNDLLQVWAEEGKAALKAKKSGMVLDLWKVVAERKVIAVVCVEDPAEADRMSLDLPIMKKMGDRVHVECKSIRPIEKWFEDLKSFQNGQ